MFDLYVMSIYLSIYLHTHTNECVCTHTHTHTFTYQVFAIDCTKAMVGLPQKFPASAAALKGVAPVAGAEALTKSVA